MATTTANPVVDAINQVTSDARVRLAMLMGARLESSWNTLAVGDGGTSFGAFQIHLPAHPGVTATNAKDPLFASRYMLPAYQSGVARVNVSLWNSDPALAAATAAYYAERPSTMYATSRVRSVWDVVRSAWNGGPLAPDTGSAVDGIAIPNPLSSAKELWTTVSQFLYDTFGQTVDFVYFGLLIAGGVGIVGTGLLILTSEGANVPGLVGKVVS